MKKYIIAIILCLLVVSCSEKVDFEGQVKGGSPLERIEFVEATGVATLPLVNVGIDADGQFKGTFDAPKNGTYLMTYAGKQKLFYLKKGQSLKIAFDANDFPEKTEIQGDAKNNNLFLDKSQKEMFAYSEKVGIDKAFEKSASEFVSFLQKTQQYLTQNNQRLASEMGADDEVLQWRENDVKIGILNLLAQYENAKKEENKEAFQPINEFKNYRKQLLENEDELVSSFPVYRAYLLNQIADEFEDFHTERLRGKIEPVSVSNDFVKFLKTKKDLSPLAKDYLIAFVMAQRDILPTVKDFQIDHLHKIIENHVHEKQVKTDLKKVIKAVAGLKIGEQAPDSELISSDGKPVKMSSFKGKPSLVMFYASWSPNVFGQVQELREMGKIYGDDIQLVAVNLDDTQTQFLETSKALMRDIKVKNVYAKGGLKSSMAKDYFIYGFKLKPSYLVLNKDGEISSRFYFELKNEQLQEILHELSGIN